MKIKNIKKPLLQRLLKTNYSKKTKQTADNKKVIQEQDCSATHLEEIEKDVKHKQHRAAAGTHNFLSPSKSLKHMKKQRQTVTPYTHSQRSDPTPSLQKTVQMVTQRMNKLSPKLNLRTQLTSRVHSTDVATPAPLMIENLSDNLPSSQAQAVSQIPPELPTAHPHYYFCTDEHNIRTLPQDLLFPLQPGNEIQWAQITLATLEEFSFINDKLKLQCLMHQMTNHNTAHQAASAQLLQAIEDPTHNPLHAFFKWLNQSYSLTKQERNTCLRKAINEQNFDWRNNPAIDLQNAISQAHMSLPEINDTEIFRETLRDALKHKLQPRYHLIADSNLTDLPDKLRHIWKNIAIPQPKTRTITEADQSIISNAISTTDFNQSTKQSTTYKSPLNNANTTSHQYLAKQIQSLSRILTQLQQLQSQTNSLRPSRLRRLPNSYVFSLSQSRPPSQRLQKTFEKESLSTKSNIYINETKDIFHPSTAIKHPNMNITRLLNQTTTSTKQRTYFIHQQKH